MKPTDLLYHTKPYLIIISLSCQAGVADVSVINLSSHLAMVSYITSDVVCLLDN